MDFYVSQMKKNELINKNQNKIYVINIEESIEDIEDGTSNNEFYQNKDTYSLNILPTDLEKGYDADEDNVNKMLNEAHYLKSQNSKKSPYNTFNDNNLSQQTYQSTKHTQTQESTVYNNLISKIRGYFIK